jgi:ABC-type Fe3+-hydroxamate transport system substrate-binding protein
MRINKWILPTLVAFGLLSACGGGGNSSQTSQQQTPEPVTINPGVETQVTTVISEAERLIANNTNDMADPEVLGEAELAMSDTDEPADI